MHFSQAAKLVLGYVVATVSVVAQADWAYKSRQDKLTSETVVTAEIISINSMDLGFPYKGKNTGRLSVIKHGKAAPVAVFDFDKGQTMCSNPDACNLLIRFDEDKPVSFYGDRPADRSTNIVFIKNASKFISLASKAKRIYVGLNIYQNGTQLLEFTTAKPLEWKPSK